MQEEDRYGAFVLTAVLLFINVAIIGSFFWQVYLTWTEAEETDEGDEERTEREGKDGDDGTHPYADGITEEFTFGCKHCRRVFATADLASGHHDSHHPQCPRYNPPVADLVQRAAASLEPDTTVGVNMPPGIEANPLTHLHDQSSANESDLANARASQALCPKSKQP